MTYTVFARGHKFSEDALLDAAQFENEQDAAEFISRICTAISDAGYYWQPETSEVLVDIDETPRFSSADDFSDWFDSMTDEIWESYCKNEGWM